LHYFVKDRNWGSFCQLASSIKNWRWRQESSRREYNISHC